MKLDNLNSLEEQLEKPAYLLFLIVILLFLIIGFVNLLDHTSVDAAVFGIYSIPYVGIILAYGAGMIGWASLLRHPNDDTLVFKVVDWVQKRPFLILAFFIGSAIVIWTMINIEQWVFYPAMQVTVLVLIAFTLGILLIHQWGSNDRPQLWRKVTVVLLGLLVVAELTVQLLSLFGLLPSITVTTNSFGPNSRIYQAEEGYLNRVANKNGWNYPEFQLAPDSKRVILIGDGNIQAIQVEPEQNMGIVIQELLQTGETSNANVEVLSLGYPDFGPGIYLDPALFDFAIDAYQPDEIIAFFDLSNDFQIYTEPTNNAVFFEADEQGTVAMHPFSSGVRHDFQHLVIHVYEGFQPVRFLQSHYLTPRLVDKLINPRTAQAAAAGSAQNSELGLANSFVFNETTNGDAIIIATGLIKNAANHLAAQDIKLSLVTIPVFTDGFYQQPDDANWQTQFGEADLLLPEREIRAFAAENDIPFLALGSYLESADLTTSDIQDLYFNEGRGHFTPAGHERVGTAVYDCFIAQTLTSDAGCDVR